MKLTLQAIPELRIVCPVDGVFYDDEHSLTRR